ncbi:MAG TPA: GlxA family transcriptional regulator [Caulobacteraceae bacterium]|jgi:transcriptional regulator GlxA family with amidase domain|nr:GlxA family transcriptional regulator [Caulobacteraceae bacterium]
MPRTFDTHLIDPDGPFTRGGGPLAANDGEAVLSVGFILLPRFTLMALAGFVEALRHAADMRDRSRQIQCRWSILGPNQRPVRSSCGVSVAPWETFGEAGPFDYIVVIGGLLSGHDAIDPKIPEFVTRTAAQGGSLVGLCTGSFLLARAGLMDGRRCCVSYYHAEEFEAEFGGRDIKVVADALFVADRGRITCAGGLGAVDLALSLLERHLGSHRAQKSMTQMLFDRARPPTAPQPRFDASWHAAARHPTTRRAVLLMELHVNDPIPMGALADQLGVSLKALERLFQADFSVSPAAFYKTMRLEIAERMLKESTRPIMNIALDCGFGDLSYFGRAFKAAVGVSPRDFRNRYIAAARASAELAGAG